MKQNKEICQEVNVRKLALDLMIQIMEDGVFYDKALHHCLEKYPMEKRDRSFLSRLVGGSVERCMELDYVIDQFSKIIVQKMKPVIRNILRISVYQILYMDQVPDSAVCNEAVKLTVKRKFHNLKGFVNGVLRTIVRKKEEIPYPDRADTLRFLSVRYSMPEWLTRRFLTQFGEERTEKILQSFLEDKGGTSVRCNLSVTTLSEMEECLQKQDVCVKKGTLLPYARHIYRYPSLKELEAFQKGMFQVQDESSMLVGEIADVKKGNLVIDVCAAPGGKTFHVADKLASYAPKASDEAGMVFSCDLTSEKTDLIRENKKRLGCHNVEIFVNDATVLREEWVCKADFVIADLPCSGLGVIGKKCDIKYKTKEEDITSLAAIQREILKVVSQYVKPGGKLIFSTCTIAEEENQNNVQWIKENLPFVTLSIEDKLPKCLQRGTGKDGYLQVLPDVADSDGFFLSMFERKR